MSSEIRVSRLRDRPLIESGAVPGYGPIFNAGLLHQGGTFHLFARGVRRGYRRHSGPGPRFSRYVSDILLFSSDDGLEYNFQKVLLGANGGDPYAYEDPRVQRIRSDGSERIVMTYTHLPAPTARLPWRVGLAELSYCNGEFDVVPGSECVVGPDGREDKDAVLFNLTDGRVAFYHRIYPNIQLAVFDSLEDLIAATPEYWRRHVDELSGHTVLRPAPDAHQVGAGAPPVMTGAGPVLFFHQRSHSGVYANYAALLDEATGQIRAFLREPILVPETSWERNGDVDHVVYVQGAHCADADSIYLTYGAADRCVGGARVSQEALLEALASSSPPGPAGEW